MPDEQDLAKLQAEYKKLQEDIATLQEQAAATQLLLQATDAQITEIASATEGYDQSATDMQSKLDDEQKTIGKKRPTAEFKVKDLKAPIDKRIVDFDAALADQAKAVADATEAATKASAAAEQAAQALQDEQSAFAALKREPTALRGRLAEIKTLIAEVTKAEAEDDAVAMYFYLSEAAALAKGLTIPTPSDHKKQLVAAQSDVENAKTAAAAKKADSDKAAAAAAAAKIAYAAALTSRRTDLLQALRDVKAPPPLSTPIRSLRSKSDPGQG
jgi:hypothetical protein